MSAARRRRLALVAWVGLMALAAPAVAQTQASGCALPRFEPAASGSEWFALDSLDLRGHLRPAASLTFDYAYKPLVIYNADSTERAALVA